MKKERQRKEKGRTGWSFSQKSFLVQITYNPNTSHRAPWGQMTSSSRRKTEYKKTKLSTVNRIEIRQLCLPGIFMKKKTKATAANS
jgi:hypothetical protein